ncbi:L-type lectin-domain containing receptor kinase VII.1 [Coffea eugenioides]|uniref:L-type lectin-domain containing receptor kinase VII.1 n=1 Tax=Coffea eugenioides TaxID=49369 RepID=UPI000F60985B|nr:L-type lectin-domain containing receptor kinase VII.1 [Coffea eugenioides]
MKNRPQILLPYLLFAILSIQSVLAIDFVYNSFNSSSISLYGNATIESHILTLTNETVFSIGRALYPAKIVTKQATSSYVLPFSTSFIFAMAPNKKYQPGHGIVFLFVPKTGIEGTDAAQNLGLLNLTNNGLPGNHLFGVEFDVFKNEEFKDISDNHVGLDVNSLVSEVANDAGYWPDDGQPFKPLKMNDGKTYQVWIDYADSRVKVTMAPTGIKRPKQPLLNATLNLSQVFQDEMYVGFTSATGQLVESHKILAWSFSNTNFSLSDALISSGLPSFELPKDPIYKEKVLIAGMTVGLFILLLVGSLISVFLIKNSLRRKREREEMEDWELEYWPHRITYQEIEAATKNFSDENVIGVGGNGKVYRGIMPGGAAVAVKRISHQNSEGMREFISEISSLGRLKHRNLVGLRGWCKKEKGSFILVYDYMENGSLDKRSFGCDESKMLNCEDRLRIVKDVASALSYLHEGWEAKVLHRDIKASNVLLDKDMNARLGDFGLARLHDHGQVAATTMVVGTVGYMAPELVKNGRASTQTDVFGFGVLILEVICGRQPIEEGKPPLVDWAWELMRRGELLNAMDERLRLEGKCDEEEVEKMLHLGLLCAHPDPSVRPTMRQVVKFFEGKTDADESDGEDMDVHLLQRMKSRDIWPNCSISIGSHPTFDEIRVDLSSSMSLSWSKSMAEGR